MTKTFLPFHFFGDNRDQGYHFQREDIDNMLPICISNALLNMCSEPFVMVLNVRAT